MTGSVVLRGRKRLLFCEQKRSKKKLRPSGPVPLKTPVPQIQKSFLLLFFKKEGLPYLAELTD
jgi:hypothetical protein